MNKIENVVKELKIDEKRKRKEKNEKDMLFIKNAMSRLCMHKNVAMYVYHLCIEDYFKRKTLTPKDEKLLLEGRIKMMELKDDANVQMYIELRKEYERLEQECSEYYQAINIDLREKVRNLDLPNLFVYQGIFKDSNLKMSRHIIIPNACEVYIKTPNMVIYPDYEIASNRKGRHFYNRISFNYLEQLSEDYTFNPKVKKLGKIWIHDGDEF